MDESTQVEPIKEVAGRDEEPAAAGFPQGSGQVSDEEAMRSRDPMA